MLSIVLEFVIGVISDTHGLLRPEAMQALAGSDLIFHTGDVGRADILPRLCQIAPVHAVRGNIDVDPSAADLPETQVVEVQGLLFYLLHDVNALDLSPRAAGFTAVISGHSHTPVSEVRDGVLYFNPGSAGPQRFRLPISCGRLRIHGRGISPAHVSLG